MRRGWLAWLLGVAAGAAPWCEAPGQPASGIELWVDGSAPRDGNGTAERPLKSLAAALSRAARSSTRIHVAAGVYRGPFEPADGTEIDGRGAVVLSRDGHGSVLAPRGKLSLAHVVIQGGSVGIETRSDLRLTEVSLSGQRSVGIRSRAGTLTARAATISAELSEVGGIQLGDGARAWLARCRFEGPFRRAIELSGSGALDLADSTFEGAVVGVHQVGGTVAIHRTRFSGRRGPAIFSAGGTLDIVDVDTHGHEYGLQCSDGARVRALRFSSVGAERAAVALTRAKGRMEEITAIDSGSLGAVQLVGAELELRRFRLHRAQGYGLLARHSQISVADGAITDVLDGEGSAGEGIHLRGSRGSIESVAVLRSAGPGLLAAADSSVLVRDLLVENCRWGGVVAETFARIRGISWTIRKCSAPAVAVPDAAEVEVDVLSSEENSDGPFWVECAREAKLRLSRASGDGLKKKSPSRCAVIVR